MGGRKSRSTSKGGKWMQDTKVVVAFIGVIGTILAALITAYFSYRSVRLQTELPIRMTQTAQASQAVLGTQVTAHSANTATIFPTSTHIIPTSTIVVPNAVRVELREMCEARAMPEPVGRSGSGANVMEEIVELIESNNFSSLPIVPSDDTGMFDLRFRIMSTSEREWVEVSNEAGVTVTVDQEIDRDINVVKLAGCGGGGQSRFFPVLDLSTEYRTYALETTYPSFDFFTLQPGEFEIFVLPFRCAQPGYYLLSVNFPYWHEGESAIAGVARIAALCPYTFTVWTYDPAGSAIVGARQYVWDGEMYTELP